MALIHTVVILALALLNGIAEGFWRMRCPGLAALARIDPLVSPGEPGAHIHALFGSSGMNTSIIT